ncbi:hypothetical protein ACJJIQ_00130 (plasmid) [Microbulbifer sp. ANSA003]|uniref:hypothetical protein n=1 Tax=Microbulbifer sp. ANSA003 TaxID=3243360 RepID=UPI004043135C
MSEKRTYHGPADFSMEVWLMNDEQGQVAKVTVGLGTFKFPTFRDIQQRLESVTADLEEKEINGFRLATKSEAFNECFGVPVAAPGGTEWDPVSPTVDALMAKVERFATTYASARNDESSGALLEGLQGLEDAKELYSELREELEALL